MADVSAEQEARDMLERMGIEDAQAFTSGDVVELGNLINEAAQTWRSIDSAPKDGTHIFGWRHGWDSPHPVRWILFFYRHGDVAKWSCGGDALEADDAPTHWMPIPTPPS
jgi:hypothetical protein